MLTLVHGTKEKGLYQEPPKNCVVTLKLGKTFAIKQQEGPGFKPTIWGRFCLGFVCPPHVCGSFPAFYHRLKTGS